MKTQLFVIGLLITFFCFGQNTTMDVQQILLQAKEDYAQKRFEKVESDLSALLSENDNNYIYVKLLADAKHKLEKYEAAVELYSDAIKLNKDDFSVFFNRGAARIFLFDYKNALKDLNIAIKMHPDSAEMFYYKGYAEAKLFKYNDAIVSYNKAIELKPNYAAAIYNRGAAKGELDEFDAGMADFNKALALQPDLDNGYLNLALANLGLEKYQEAIEGFDKVIELRDQNLAKAYFYRGEALFELDKRDEACNDYNRAMNLGYEYAKIRQRNLCGSRKKDKRTNIDIIF